MDTKAKRAAALGYGLSFLLVLPPADGSLDIPDAGHALNAYRYDMPAAVLPPEWTHAVTTRVSRSYGSDTGVRRSLASGTVVKP